MVFSSVLIKFPFQLIWKTKQHSGKLHELVIYVHSYQDYKVFESMLPYLHFPYIVCSANKKVKSELASHKVDSSCWPVFGKTVLMARHAFHKFPIKEIKKIGMRHGPYHFKEFISSAKYNMFDLYLFTSEKENEIAIKKGITSGQAGGYPKLDLLKDASDSERTIAIRRHLREVNKNMILFSATWNGSGMSAIDKWVYRLNELVSEFELAVTIHPKMDHNYIQFLESNTNVTLISQEDLPIYINSSDFLISDTSSIIAEFCALNKPIITFKVDSNSTRLTTEIKELIQNISVQIESFDEIRDAINCYKKNADLKKDSREYYNKIMFDDVNICHGKKCADIINSKLLQIRNS